jgi:hypothetical protein
VVGDRCGHLPDPGDVVVLDKVSCHRQPEGNRLYRKCTGSGGRRKTPERDCGSCALRGILAPFEAGMTAGIVSPASQEAPCVTRAWRRGRIPLRGPARSMPARPGRNLPWPRAITAESIRPPSLWGTRSRQYSPAQRSAQHHPASAGAMLLSSRRGDRPRLLGWDEAAAGPAAVPRSVAGRPLRCRSSRRGLFSG